MGFFSSSKPKYFFISYSYIPQNWKTNKDADVPIHGSCLFQYCDKKAIGYWLMYMQEEKDTVRVVIHNILEIEKMSWDVLVKKHIDVTPDVDSYMDYMMGY